MDKGTQSYKDLVVWQKAIAVVKSVYSLTQNFPAEEQYGLVSQMRRASVSIPSNIAEGEARHTTGEFIQFISHAEGSVAELNTQVILAGDLTFGTSEAAKLISDLLEEVRKMLNGVRRKLAGES